MKIINFIVLALFFVPIYYSYGYLKFNPTNEYNRGCFTYPYGSCDLERGILLEDLRHEYNPHYERYHYNAPIGYHSFRRVRIE